MQYRLALTLVLVTLCHHIAVVSAATYQQCETNSICTIGEFLYADDYTALPSQSCTITAKYPDGTSFITSAAMTSRSDGYYSYNASIGTTTGLYSATICCTPSSGLMCLDKSFEVKSPTPTPPSAADIWSYSSRTLSSYGTLAADIWSYSSRSLTSFGNLVSEIWGHSSRTMTSFGSLVANIWGYEDRELTGATPVPNSLQSIITEQQTQREMLEKLVNAPIITLEIGEGESADLSQKLDNSHKIAGTLYDSIQSTKSRLLSLDLKWGKLTSEGKTAELTEIMSLWSNNQEIANLQKAWDTPLLSEIQATATNLKDVLALALVDVGNKTAPLALTNSLAALSELEAHLGDITSSSTDTTFFGYLAQVKEKDALLEGESQKLTQLLENWNGIGESHAKDQLDQSQKRLQALSPLTLNNQLLSPSGDALGKTALKNRLLSLEGFTKLSRKQLASNVGTPVRGLWLEEGSIIFRAVISNPSSLITQDAQIRFLLPQETTIEDIESIDDNLKAAYDVSAGAIAVTGTFSIAPKAVEVASVELKDVWVIDHALISSLGNKASELSDSLKKGNLHAQGVALKSEIESRLRNVRNGDTPTKPENRIRAFREAQLQIAQAQGSLTELENLVAIDSSNRSLIGFVGGANTISVLGIILVVVGGFVFLSRYFAKLNGAGMIAKEIPLSLTAPLTPAEDSQTSPSLTLPTTLTFPRPAVIAAIVIATASTTAVAIRLMSSRGATEPTINQIVPPAISPTPLASPSPTPSPTNNVNIGSIVPPTDSSVNIRNKPSSSADIVMSLRQPTEIIIFTTQGDWTQIGFNESDRHRGYWVSTQFIETK